MSVKRRFWDELNRHYNAEYRAVGPFVVEFERLPRDRASIAIWRGVEDDGGVREPRKGSFMRVVRSFGDRDLMRAEFDRIRDRDDVADAKVRLAR
jgi:hypothetical protein